MKIATFLIDTFTAKPFTGNPTAVCLHDHNLDSKSMSSIASELNCPVTAFVRAKSEKNIAYDIRYFTSITEIAACGHATLAAAKLILEDRGESQAIAFYTVRDVVIKAFSTGQSIMMIYPAYPEKECEVDERILNALGLDGYLTAMHSIDLETLFIEVRNVSLLKKVTPDYKALLTSCGNIKEVVITSVSDHPKYDYYLRSFCPWIGIDEDPVTGSVQTILGTFWKKRLNKEKLKAYQASPRGGEVRINAFEDHVEIGGEAVIIMKGEITI